MAGATAVIHRFDVDAIERERTLVPFCEVFPFADPIEVEWQGRAHLVDDHHCVVLSCPCRDAVVALVPLDEAADGGPGPEAGLDVFGEVWHGIDGDPRNEFVAAELRDVVRRAVPDPEAWLRGGVISSAGSTHRRAPRCVRMRRDDRPDPGGERERSGNVAGATRRDRPGPPGARGPGDHRGTPDPRVRGDRLAHGGGERPWRTTVGNGGGARRWGTTVGNGGGERPWGTPVANGRGERPCVLQKERHWIQ